MTTSSAPASTETSELAQLLEELGSWTPTEQSIARSLGTAVGHEKPIMQIFTHLSTTTTEPLEIPTSLMTFEIRRPRRHLTRNGEIAIEWDRMKILIQNRDRLIEACRKDAAN